MNLVTKSMAMEQDIFHFSQQIPGRHKLPDIAMHFGQICKPCPRDSTGTFITFS